jgi:mannose-6-phosphate isomerase-like protein (cupin superfamily)
LPKIENRTRPGVELHGVSFTPIASPSLGSSEMSMWRAHVLPGEGVLHHMTREEIILAVGGAGVIRIGGEVHQLTPGDAFAVPAFTDFRLECANADHFEAVVALPVGGRAVIGNQPSFAPPWSV